MEPTMATVNQTMPRTGQPNRFSFHIEINAKTTQVNRSRLCWSVCLWKNRGPTRRARAGEGRITACQSPRGTLGQNLQPPSWLSDSRRAGGNQIDSEEESF